MSNIEKNYIDIPDLSCFDKNRVHEVKELNVNNSYLGVGIKNGTSYVYAIKSSPNYYSLQPQHKSDAYIYVRHNDNNNNQSYSFYRGYSYTYTEGLSANNQKMALIAYQFVNRTADNSITLYDIDTKLTHTALNGATETASCHVNEKSDISYFLRKQNESNNIEIDESSVKLGNIKSNLGNDTYAKFNTYCKYSALDPSDYIIHDDCEFNMNMGAYVWNLVDGYDYTVHTYIGLSDTNTLTAYAYIDCEDSLHSFFRNQSQIFDYDVTHYKYIDFNYDNVNVSGQQWKLGTNGTSLSYVYDNNINYAQFYANAKHDLPSHATDSFENIINHPSYRNNYSVVDSYINIKGLSQPSGTETMDISQNNYNTAKFVKKIGGLPIAIAYDPIFFTNPLETNSAGFNVPDNIPQGQYPISPKLYITFYKGVKGNRIYPAGYSGSDCYELILSQSDKIYIQYTPTIEIQVTSNQISGSHISFEGLSNHGCNKPNPYNSDYIEFPTGTGLLGEGSDFYDYTRNWTYPDGYNINKYNINNKIYFLKFKDAFVDGIYNVSYIESTPAKINESTHQGTGQPVSFSLNVPDYDGYCSTLHISTNERLFVNTGTAASPNWSIVRSGDMPFDVDSNVNTPTDAQIRFIDSTISVSGF